MKIGIFGSADNNEATVNLEKAYLVGKELAKRGYEIITGAASGLVAEAVKGAQEFKSKKGFSVIGYSPYRTKKEHHENCIINFDHYTKIHYTGAGKKGRNLIAVLKCDAGVFLRGRIGTLNEFTIAYDEGVHCAILEGLGGTMSLVPEIIKAANKPTVAKVIFDKDPKILIDKLEKIIK